MYLRESKWKYETWGSTGISVYFVAGTFGELHLKDPSGHVIKFNYVGAGLSAGPKLPKWMPAQGNTAPTEYRSRASKLYISPNFAGNELTKDDLCGPCAILDLGFSTPVYGRTVCAMFLGGGIANPLAFSPEDGAKAMIVLESDNTGFGGGGSACVGYVSPAPLPSKGVWKVRTGGRTFYYEFGEGNDIYVRWAENESFVPVGGNGHRVMNKDFMRINWIETGDFEEWTLPLSTTEQTGYWYPKKEQTRESGFRKYAITAEKIPEK